MLAVRTALNFTAHDAANGYLNLSALSKHVFAPIDCFLFVGRCVLPLFFPKKGLPCLLYVVKPFSGHHRVAS